MNKKKLMILGASQLQLPAIIKAKEKGLYVIVLDMNKNAIGVSYADEFYEISTIDKDSIVKKAEELKIDGIMTLATDMPMRAVAAVGEHLGLKTISYETAERATDKARMRECLLKNNVPIPYFFSVFTFKDFEKAVNLFHGDLIIKPADSSGSRGVYLLKGRKELQRAYDYSKKYSLSGQILVEEYMQGPEVSVETITINGTTHIIAITDKLTTGAPYFVEIGHSIQSLLSDNIKKEIEDVTKSAISALGIDNSPAHTEIIVTEEGPKIVELGARLGGDNITTSLVPLATGVDMVRACIELAINGLPDIDQKFYRGAAIRYFRTKAGKIVDICSVDKAEHIDGVKQISFIKNTGDYIDGIYSSSDRIGFIISQAENPYKAISICNNVQDLIEIRLER